MQVLLKAPGEEFFSSAKQTRNKNKTIKQLSPYAKEFFRIFLQVVPFFVHTMAQALLSDYGHHVTRARLRRTSKLGIIDFKRTPNWTSIKESSTERPYFLDFISTMYRQSQPFMIDPPVWLWICGTKEAEVQVSHYAHSPM
jgi:hypothetical protein